MDRGRLLQYGGLAAGIVLILFGIGALALSIDAHKTVGDELSPGEDRRLARHDALRDRESWSRRRASSDVDIPDCDVAEEEITQQARKRAVSPKYMRIHVLESSDGLYVRGDGTLRLRHRIQTTRPGTSDEAAAAKDEERSAGVERRA